MALDKSSAGEGLWLEWERLENPVARAQCARLLPSLEQWQPGDDAVLRNARKELIEALDGTFAENVILQIKHGPVDFQANEPTSPLFGQMTQTATGLELMITQEYTGQQVHLFYYGPLWEQVFNFDTGTTHAADPSIAALASPANSAAPQTSSVFPRGQAT